MYLDSQERVNRSALILAQEQWSERFASFVNKDQDRLAYIQSQLDSMLEDVSESLGADFEYVKSRFDAYVAEAVALGEEPKHVDVEDLGEGTSYPGDKNFTGDPSEGTGIVEVDILGNGVVLDDDAPDARIDLNDDTQKVTAYKDAGDLRDESTWKNCFRCSSKLNPVYAQTSPVCPDCTADLLKSADNIPVTNPGAGPSSTPTPGLVAPDNPDQLFKCTLCDYTGNYDNVNQHVQQAHQDALQRQEVPPVPSQSQQPMDAQTYPSFSSTKEGDFPFDEGEQDVGYHGDPRLLGDSRPKNDTGVSLSLEQHLFEQMLKEDNPRMALWHANRLQEYTGNPARTFLNRWKQMHPGIDIPGEEEGLLPDAPPTPVDEGVRRLNAVEADINDPAADVPPETVDLGDDTKDDPGVQEDKPIDVDPQDDTPADKFDTYVQDLANHAAARQFSIPDETEIQQIAQQYGLDEDQVRQSLVARATFGDFTATNGDFNGDVDNSNYVEITDLGGQVNSHEALVPVEIAVQKVAEDMNMEPNLVYNMVKDRYGADLPDKYHASVSGEHHFYLPKDLVGNQDQPQAQPYDPHVGPTPQPTQPTSRLTFKEFIDLDRKRAAEQKKLLSA
jgi:hypothetical protein